MALLAGQRLQQVGVTVAVVVVAAEVFVAVVGAFVRAAAAGRAVVRRVAGVPRRPSGAGGGVAGVVGEEAVAAQPGVGHPPADAAVTRRGRRLGLDVEVLVSRGQVQVGVLAQRSRTQKSDVETSVLEHRGVMCNILEHRRVLFNLD